MSIFFQIAQNHGFWSFDFWFLSRGKKATVICCLYECKHIIMSKTVYPQPILWVASKFVTLPQSDSSVKKKKRVNYWAEICKLLPRDRKNVVLYTVTI